MDDVTRGSLARTLLSVVIRVGVLGAGFWVYDRLWTWFFYTSVGDEPVGADIGEGLVAFALVALLAAVWAGWDAGRRPFGRVAALWLSVGVVAAVAFALRAAYADGGVVWGDLLALSPFLVGLIAFPALVGAGLVAVVRSGRRPVA